MAKTNIWIALYPKDWLADTQDLTTQQHGAYFLLSMTYVIHGAPPRDNDDELARITKLTRRAWLRERERISRFFDIRGGFWFHKRIERELSVARENSDRARSNANKRWDKREAIKRELPRAINDATASPQHMPNACPSPSPSPSETLSPVRVVEPLPNFPKSEAEAVNHAMRCAAPPEFIKTVWNKAMSRGGCDAKDIPVRNWSNYIATEWSYEQGRMERDKQKNNENRSRTHNQRPDRNAGTANEGAAGKYEGLGKVAKA
jgi:uncharacterized protein YdaU (DUF1376 family)